MKKILRTILLLVAATLVAPSLWAQSRRPIDSEHPMWLMHVDVWNEADPQKIINLIPDDIKPYVVMNLSLSCSYDTDLDIYLRPQNGIATYKSWASVCQANNMWFICQPASGGHTHIQDDDLEIFEYFYKTYPNFLGWNYAEQFWGFDVAGDKSSSSQVTRIALFAKLVEMAHQYGGFLTVSFCGNIWSHALNPVGMLKRNSDLYKACAAYPEAILWLYKYTTSACFYNNESVSFGPFVAGLAANYGVRYDNCGYSGALDEVLGEGHTSKYPVAAGIGTVMEQSGVNGGAVWDGPELIWTEDFQNKSNSTVGGYTRRNWGTFAGFDNAWIDMFRKIIDRTIYIPSRAEVVANTKIILINDVTSGSDQNKYATWDNLYDNLYKQTDPMNRNTGQWMENGLYLKSTGRYRTIPMTPGLNDDLSKSIPVQKKSSAKWATLALKVNDYNQQYPSVSTGDLYVNRYRNQLITYTPYSYLNVKKRASSVIPLQYNTCSELDLSWGKLSSATVREYADHIDFYLNNYRSDTTTNIADSIIVRGVTAQPTVTYTKRVKATGTVSYQYDSLAATLTVCVSHNGPVDLTLGCTGDATDRLTDILDSTALGLPQQPEAQPDGKFIVEAEDMDYKSITACVLTPYYTSYKAVRGHVGNGFMHMGTNKAGGLTHTLTRQEAGTYRLQVRYSTTSSSAQVTVSMNGTKQVVDCPKTGDNVWRKAEVTVEMQAGSNKLIVTNTGAKDMYIDNVTYMPATMADEQFPITIRTAEHGSATSSVATAAEGEVVTLTVTPDAGYAFAGWELVHGSVTIADDGTFEMPDDIVTLRPLFTDATLVYSLDLDVTSSLPVGWRAMQESSELHEYPNTYTSGSRIMTGFTTSYTNKALYWRDGYADYGRLTDYPLTLEPGQYEMRFAMAAWKSSPYYVAQILTGSDVVVAKSGSLAAAPNANGSSSATLTSAVERTLKFTITKAGDYTIRFVNEDRVSGLDEFLLLACNIHGEASSASSALESVVASSTAAVEGIYSVDGKLRPALQPGLNIIRMSDGSVKKVWMK